MEGLFCYILWGVSNFKLLQKKRADMESLAHNLIGGSKPPPYNMEIILQVCTKK